MQIRVNCYAGYRGEETPRLIVMGDQRIAVASIQDRWIAPDHRYFKLVGKDGGLYIIRHDPNRDIWELTFYTCDPMMTGTSPTNHAFSPSPNG